MKIYILSLLLIAQSILAQYTIKSPYLLEPELSIGYVDSCAKFWMNAYEPVNGGFYTNINRQGNISGSSIKNTLNQSRDAYGFVRAFQMTGDTTYLRYAQYGLDFMYTYAWDNVHGGWNNDINSNGSLANPTANKTAFYQHYAMLGITARYEAMRDTTDWNWLMRSYEYNESHLWDSSAASFGYYDIVHYDGTLPADKSFNSTVDAVTTHLLHLYLMTSEKKYKDRLLQIADNMINRLAASVPQQQIGFAEIYTAAWAPKSAETMTIMGHVLKTGWCLARIYQLEKDPQLMTVAEQLVQMVLDQGYDHQNGGPYKDYNRTTGQMLMWGISDTAKAWWQMEQAVTSGLMLYHITGKEKYLQMADETLDFFMKYFVDHVYGDVFENTNKYGGMIAAWGTTKGGTGKAAYHSIETGYYTYLYGKLLLLHQPAKLYYRFDPTVKNRTYVLRPISLPDNMLSISEILKDGMTYQNFDGGALTITIPADTGGIFAVTFQSKIIDHVASPLAAPGNFTLFQNYPNPFNPTTMIRYQIPAGGYITLTVYDILGREVNTLVNEPKEAGTYSVTFDASKLTGGIYFARLMSNEHQQVIKMAIVK
ncbi:MAG: AGE family epimerase/isomerase [Bacteroidota bacterium]